MSSIKDLYNNFRANIMQNNTARCRPMEVMYNKILYSSSSPSFCWYTGVKLVFFQHFFCVHDLDIEKQLSSRGQKMSDAKRNREYDAKRDREHDDVMRGAVLTRCTKSALQTTTGCGRQ